MKYEILHKLILVAGLGLLINQDGFSQSLMTPIDKGVIKDNFSITFVDKNITLKPNESFALSSLGIQPRPATKINLCKISYFITF